MQDIQKKVAKYLADRGWDTSSPGDMAKSVSIESAELLELFQWGNPTATEIKQDKQKFTNLKKELADVLIYCIDLAVLLDVDVEQIILEKLKYNEKKFPAKKVKGNAKEYFAIKKSYRKKGY